MRISTVFLIFFALLSKGKSQVNQQWTHSFTYEIDNGTTVVENNALLWIADTLKPVRGIIITSMVRNEAEFTHDPEIREVMKEEQLAHLFLFRVQIGNSFEGGPISTFDITLKHDTLLLYVLKNFALISGRPEIEHAPWMTFGHSTAGIFAKNLAWWKPERMFGVIFYKTGGYQPPGWLENPDTTAFLNIPWLSVAARIDRFGPGEDGWRIMRQEMMPWRGRGSLMNQIVEPTWVEGHSVWRPFNAPYLARFIKNAAQSRIPKDTTALYGPVPLLQVDAAKGVLSDTIISALIDKPDISEHLLRFSHDASVEEAGKMFWHFDLESAIEWVNYHRKDFGPFVPERDTIINGKIDYWNKNIPLGPQAFGLFETAMIKGLDTLGNFHPFYSTVADDLGDFQLISFDKVVTVDYDMKGDYNNPVRTPNMLQFINGMDAYFLEKIISDDTGFKPNVFQIWAADVNMDGIVDSTDLSQLIDRALDRLPEFRQQWNYKGMPGPVIQEPSLDWLFYEYSRTRLNVPTRISRDYPDDDGSGFSRHRIPPAGNKTIPPFDIGNPYPKYNEAEFKGIMLGDLDGSLANPMDASSQDFTVRANINELTEGNEKSWIVGLSPENISTKKMVSVDIEILIENPDLRILEVNKELEIQSFHQVADDTFARILSWDANGIGHAEVLASIVIGGNDVSEFNPDNIRAFVNGLRVDINSIYTTNTRMEISNNYNIRLLPNPAKDRLNVSFTGVHSEKILYRAFDTNGKMVISGNFVPSHSPCQINISDLPPGVYIMELSVDDSIFREYFVVTGDM